MKIVYKFMDTIFIAKSLCMDKKQMVFVNFENR